MSTIPAVSLLWRNPVVRLFTQFTPLPVRLWVRRAVGIDPPVIPRANVKRKDKAKQVVAVSAEEEAARRLAEAQVVQNHWDHSTNEGFIRDMTRRSWCGIPQMHCNLNALTTGRRDYYWMRYLRERYFPDGNGGDALSLGCGEGHVDRLWKDEGLRFRSFTGIDISPASVRRAQELADAHGLSPNTRYFVADLNTYQLPKHSYDFIYFFQSLHHIEGLESVLSTCAEALRPGGVMMVNEYVGPNRFQWTDLQYEMANKLVGFLPEALRPDLLREAKVLKTRCTKLTAEEMFRGDPSEAVRSAHIEPVLRHYFDVVEEARWGGTLNFLVLENIAGNFDPDNPYHNCIVELLMYLENELVQRNILPSDFKCLMVRPKKGLSLAKVRLLKLFGKHGPEFPAEELEAPVKEAA